ncbi:hypothetical protein GGI25_004524 [Coemansia spiralis]|uniref:Uncharacterized protein n=2 Tax=Coemansia TaxID=4863 RepID=A0A9W8G094_9FUNG|nr:hypothetical protein BX070DRAFT_229640 [Coemansia spiralis]KAJ1990169.1 hypothetical protein EDC05_004225 [Coemansia umbellata]KAJ2620694.1 hypothetical protein GGI26_004772 [Coemansia sp. RSA 1358]KAJ2673957.1 hypothetical protein GGI25_004524 [Coemansia spiralis]
MATPLNLTEQQLVMADLFQLLDEMDAHDLTRLLQSEHEELLALRSQTHVYESAIAELKSHLHNVFAVAGGLDTLPLSAATRGALGLSEMQPAFTEKTLLSSLMLPITPQSPLFLDNSAETRSPSLLLESLSSNVDRSSVMLPPWRVPIFSKRVHVSTTERSIQTETTVGANDCSENLVRKLSRTIADLRQTVAEQHSDLEDLKGSLDERKTLVRTLRKQLREHELRQFTAASDYAGLRRTASIMAEGGGALAHLCKSMDGWASTDFSITSNNSSVDVTNSGSPALLDDNSVGKAATDLTEMQTLSHIPSAVSSADATQTGGIHIGQYSPLPPVPQSDIVPSTCGGDSIAITTPTVSVTQGSFSMTAGTIATHSRYDHSRTYFEGKFNDVASTATASSSGSIACYTDDMSTTKLPKASRTPSRLRLLMTKTPRRIYSSFSSRFRKSTTPSH